MQCNHYHYEVDGGFPKASALGGEAGTAPLPLLESQGRVLELETRAGVSRERSVFSRLVSLRACPGKRDLRSIREDFPRNGSFWDARMTGTARPVSGFTVEGFQFPLHVICDSWSY